MKTDLDDSREDALSPKWTRHTLQCDRELIAMIRDFRARHGEHKTAESLRELIRAGLPEADQKLRKAASK